jgi:hypothetical protein
MSLLPDETKKIEGELRDQGYQRENFSSVWKKSEEGGTLIQFVSSNQHKVRRFVFGGAASH